MKKILTIMVLVLNVTFIYAQNDTILYSFFSAGHTYGNPNNPHYGLHYPFVDYIPEINNYPTMELGFLTGDVVVSSTVSYWDSAMVDINSLNVPIYIAAGNHDISDEFSSRFDYYFDFIHKNDLFIVLTPGLDSWNITGDQLVFFQNSLESNYSNVNNIFIFMHELIWWSPTNEYQDVDINYVPHYPGSTNYEDVVKPLLLSYPNQITVFAGDLGCVDQVSPFMYSSFENVTLIGSGMGGGVRDNIIITNVYQDSVYYDLISLNNPDENHLGEIYDYITSTSEPTTNELVIYPNPASNYLFVNNPSLSTVNVEIYNLKGMKVRSYTLHNENKIDVSSLMTGIYFVLLKNEETSIGKKVIINN